MPRRGSPVEPVEIRPPLVLEVPLPPDELSLNGRLHYQRRATLARDYKDVVAALALQAVPPDLRPYFPASVPFVRVDIRVERRRGGQRRDHFGVYEACKHPLDGTEGIIVNNDRVYFAGGPVLWDETPTGRGLMILTITGLATYDFSSYN